MKTRLSIMDRVHLQDNEWTKILAFLRTRQDIYVGKEVRCRGFLDGVVWAMRSGAKWRLLPSVYGKWNSLNKRFARWCDKGVWTAMLEHFADDADLTNLLVDSTIVRAHSCAAGASAAQGGQASPAPGRSRGGGTPQNQMRVAGPGGPPPKSLPPGPTAPHPS